MPVIRCDVTKALEILWGLRLRAINGSLPRDWTKMSALRKNGRCALTTPGFYFPVVMIWNI